MSKFFSAGGLVGLLSLASAIATAFGKAPLAAVLSDPQTAVTANILVSGVGAVVAGVLSNKPVASAAPKA